MKSIVKIRSSHERRTHKKYETAVRHHLSYIGRDKDLLWKYSAIVRAHHKQDVEPLLCALRINTEETSRKSPAADPQTHNLTRRETVAAYEGHLK